MSRLDTIKAICQRMPSNCIASNNNTSLPTDKELAKILANDYTQITANKDRGYQLKELNFND